MKMEKQGGMDLDGTDNIQTERHSVSNCKNYMILKATLAYDRGIVNFVIQKQDSYELALEVALDIFKVPEYYRPKVILKCRLKGSPVGTPWMHIQPAVWKEIVEDMEFYLSGFKPDLRP